ncbi:MAG: polysaccharide deacetylase family protein [Peptostreptococcaceae bacterium]|nr:polysaccharide deacetylase family protein [Peptostreptococcaceae bacterium]
MRIELNSKRKKNHYLIINKKLKMILFMVAILMAFMLGCGNSDQNPDRNSDITGGTEPTQGAVLDTDPVLTPEAAQEPQPEPVPVETPTPTPTPPLVKDSSLNLTASTLVWGGTSTSEAKQIALTFDSGWEYDKTLQLLDVLDQYQVKATFFLRGGWVEDHSELAREIASRGHLIENHSQAHAHMNAMTEDEVSADIMESTNIMKDTIGYTPTMFRFPYGEYNNRLLNVLGEHGYQYAIMWTIDSHDWAETMNGVNVTEQYIIDRVLNKASDNGIVLMHVGGSQTANALPEIITGLRDAGYELVRMDELITE